MEGLTYIPSSSPVFPDHLAIVVWDDLLDGPNRIEVMRRDGVVVSQIFRTDWPGDFTAGNHGDVAFLAPNRVLVTTFTNRVWTMDLKIEIHTLYEGMEQQGLITAHRRGNLHTRRLAVRALENHLCSYDF